MMEFRGRAEALAVLGLKEPADEERVKKAYREQSKRYHPDENPAVDTRARYDAIQAAYLYLKAHPSDPVPVGRILGDTGMMKSEAVKKQEQLLQAERERRRAVKARHAETERKRKAARKAAYEREEAREKQEAELREQAYNEAMKKIKAIRAARAIEAMLDLYREPEA